MLPEAPAERHRAVSATFSGLVRGTTDWGAAAPVDGWTARDVVAHLVEWLPALLHGGAGVTLPVGPPAADDPVAAWTTHAAGVQAVLDDPATADRVLSNPHFGEVPLAEGIDRFYTTDVFMHSWDLAHATGQDETIDADECARLLTEMAPIEEMLRSSGQYGPAVVVPEGASVQDRLAGFLGRDPSR